MELEFEDTVRTIRSWSLPIKRASAVSARERFGGNLNLKPILLPTATAQVADFLLLSSADGLV